MADNTIKVKFQAATKQFQRDLKIAKNSLKGFSDQSKSLGRSLSKNISAPLAIAGGIALKQSMKFERLKTSLKVLTGSAEQGSIAFENLSKFSAKTPFQLDELASANNKLMGFGLSASQSLESLKLLGDVAAVSGGDLNGMTVAFGQAAAEGRLMTRDIMQLVNNGVPAYKLLAEEVGVSSAEIRKMASEGEISFEILVGALQNATAEGGMFANGMGVLSETVGGKISTLKDNLSIGFAEIGNAIIDAFDLKTVLDNVIKFVAKYKDAFLALDDSTKKTIVIIGGIATAIGPLLVVIGTVLVPLAKGFVLLKTAVLLASTAFRNLGMAMLANPIGLIVSGLALTVLALKELAEYLNPAVDGFKTLFNAIKSGGNYTKFMALQTESISVGLNGMNEETSELDKNLDKFNTNAKKALSTLKNFGKTTDDVTGEILDFNSILTEGLGDDPTFDTIIGFKDMIKGDYETAAFDPNDVEVMDENDLDLFPNLGEETESFEEKMQKIKNIANAVGNEVLNAFNQMGQGLVNSLGLADSGLEGFIKNMVSTITQLVSMMLAASISQSIAGATASGTSTGPAAVFTTPAFIATAVGGVLSAFAAIPAFADGGIVSGPTLGLMGEYGGARSNPEVIAPLDKLKGMIGDRSQNINVGGEFRVQGQDLVLALQRADRNRGRIK